MKGPVCHLPYGVLTCLVQDHGGDWTRGGMLFTRRKGRKVVLEEEEEESGSSGDENSCFPPYAGPVKHLSRPLSSSQNIASPAIAGVRGIRVVVSSGVGVAAVPNRSTIGLCLMCGSQCCSSTLCTCMHLTDQTFCKSHLCQPAHESHLFLPGLTRRRPDQHEGQSRG
jgi:hypothetical protein